MALWPGGPALAQSAGTGGSAPGESRDLSFQAVLNSSLNHRESTTLAPGSSSSQSGRAMLGLSWSLVGSRTSLVASLNPYYERFLSNDGFASYGGSAGLGMSRRVSPRYGWNLSGTLSAAPDQDVPAPVTSEDPAVPTVQVLVPRNGFVAGSMQVGNAVSLSERASLNVGTNASVSRFRVYDAGEEGQGATSDLVDARSLGLTVGASLQTSQRSSWSGSLSASQFSLGNAPAGGSRDGRTQAALGGSYSRTLGPRSQLSIGTGMSTIETGGGTSVSTPTLNVGWGLSGERLSTRFNLSRSQGIFPASDDAVDSTQLAASLALEPWRRASLSLGAGYGLSRAAGNSGGGDSRTRNLNASFRLFRRVLGWSVSLNHARQSSDAEFGRSLEFTNVATTLIWRLAGAGGRP